MTDNKDTKTKLYQHYITVVLQNPAGDILGRTLVNPATGEVLDGKGRLQVKAIDIIVSCNKNTTESKTYEDN